MKRVVLVNPPMVGGKGDITGTGVPYWPIVLAQLAAILKNDYDLEIVDLFGMEPRHAVTKGKIVRYGVDISEINDFVIEGDLVVVFSGHAIGHSTVLDLIKEIRGAGAKKILVVEGSNFVNGYPLDKKYDDFISLGAVPIAGDPYGVIVKAIEEDYRPSVRHLFMDIDTLPIPDWTEFPLISYWSLPYAHAPKTDSIYVQIYTSFGCNNRCAFCTNPYMNFSCWRPRPVSKVLEEMRHWYDEGVREFHIEDLNPTPTGIRAKELFKAIATSGMDVTLKIASGTRIDELGLDDIDIMYEAGVRYLSFSPESGSDVLLIKMNKKFSHWHALNIIRHIRSKYSDLVMQACFILGYPGETEENFGRTKRLVMKMAKMGVDEFAFFNFMPSLGSTFDNRIKISTDDMTFSSDWRLKNSALKALRFVMIIEVYLIKMIFNPLLTLRNFSKTKIWMVLKRRLL